MNKIFLSLAGLLIAAKCLPANSQTTTPPASGKPEQIQSTVTLPTADGTLTIRSGMPAQPAAGPAPAFAILDQRMRGYLDEEDARGYPPLATDFIHADVDRNGQITRHEYERWLSKP